jgi:enamine deaminase RidA (YjgF/YER057c/UK114 family)
MPPTLHPIRASPPPIVRPGGENHIRSDLSAGEKFNGLLEAQTRAAMDGIKQTLDASGASFKDVVHFFVFRARPRMGDIGKASAVINSYFAPFNHKPTSTNVAVLELGEPEQLIEIQMVAVVD